jgi:TonB family protein
LEKIILKSLNKTCDKRYQSAAAMIADLETFMVKKYNYMPGPVQLSHFIYRLFEKEIVRDGIKVELKPLPEKPLLREILKAQPEPPKPLPVQESKIIQPAAPPLAVPSPLQPVSSHAEMRIDFDEDKSIKVKKKATAAPKEIKKAEPLFKESSEEKSKRPAWAIALVLMLMTAAALVYFLVLKKKAPEVNQAEIKPPISEKTAAQTQIAQYQTPAVDPQVLAAEKKKQEEELQKQLKDAADAAEKKKLQDDKRAKQAEIERLKKEEEDRINQEELDRLQKEEAQKKQDELDRLQKEAQDLKKAEELKEIERNRVKEGDIIALNEVDKAPVAISSPAPVISPNMRSSMADTQTVLFNILINQNGDVESARLLQKTNNTPLNTVLIATIKTWKYTPAMKNGVRVKVWKTVPLTLKK